MVTRKKETNTMGIAITIHGEIEDLGLEVDLEVARNNLEGVILHFLYDSPNYSIEEHEDGFSFNTSIKNDWRPFVEALRKEGLYGQIEFFAIIPSIEGEVVFTSNSLEYKGVESST